MTSLFKGPPKPPKPAPMPVLEDPDAEEARQLAMRRRKDLVGRTDTVLSGYSQDTLGTK
jgi:hypothetical protein